MGKMRVRVSVSNAVVHGGMCRASAVPRVAGWVVRTMRLTPEVFGLLSHLMLQIRNRDIRQAVVEVKTLPRLTLGEPYKMRKRS